MFISQFCQHSHYNYTSLPPLFTVAEKSSASSIARMLSADDLETALPNAITASNADAAYHPGLPSTKPEMLVDK